MTVRARFKITSTQQYEGGSKVVMMPMPGPESELLFEEHPTGSIVLGTLKPEHVPGFTVGREFYVDFTEAPPPPAPAPPAEEEEDDEMPPEGEGA